MVTLIMAGEELPAVQVMELAYGGVEVIVPLVMVQA